MTPQLFHIFRNTPLGRETFLQSVYFCRHTGAVPIIYIPQHTKFLMYFENDVVQVDLDASYLNDPGSSMEHAQQLLDDAGIEGRFFNPKNFTASTLPDISTNFDYMCSPRSVSDLSSKIGLGYIGPRVRRIVQGARFPVLITSPVYKPWNSIAVLFGGSKNASNALRLGIRIQRASGKPLAMYTQLENREPDAYRQIVKDENLMPDVEKFVENWYFFENGNLENHLYDIPHDALVVLGAFGHGLIRDLVFGSKMEKIQSEISNNLLIVGPNYTAV